MELAKLLRKGDKLPRCAAVIVAAGSSERMGTDKLMMELCGMPVLARTLGAFQKSPLISDIVVVTRTDRIEEIADLCHKYGISKTSSVISGGATRMESSLAGVSAVSCRAKLIAIHDGARPLVTEKIIERAIRAAAEHMAAAPVIRSSDTLKAVDEGGFIVGTVDRACTLRVQTPQVFDADLIKGALTKAAKDGLGITDDCAAVEMMGVKTYTVEGDERNIKLTTPYDMAIAQTILSDRGEADAYRARV